MSQKTKAKQQQERTRSDYVKIFGFFFGGAGVPCSC
jgi:uncharacterized membrane protein YsdA (DUF1294 family)